MVVSKDKDISEKLKKELLEKEEKKVYYSDKFLKIEKKVLASLKAQKTDDSLKDITI